MQNQERRIAAINLQNKIKLILYFVFAIEWFGLSAKAQVTQIEKLVQLPLAQALTLHKLLATWRLQIPDIPDNAHAYEHSRPQRCQQTHEEVR